MLGRQVLCAIVNDHNTHQRVKMGVVLVVEEDMYQPVGAKQYSKSG